MLESQSIKQLIPYPCWIVYKSVNSGINFEFFQDGIVDIMKPDICWPIEPDQIKHCCYSISQTITIVKL